MESCSELDAEKPSKNPFGFGFAPPHRRRPLMSETRRTLLHILSHCPASSEQDENGGTESRKETITCDGLVYRHEDAKNNDDNHEKRDNHDIQEVGVIIGDAQMKDCIDLLDHIDDAMEVNEEVPLKNIAENGISDSLENKDNQTSSPAFQLNNEQGDNSNIPESNVEESDIVKLLKMDKEISIRDACSAIESCFLMDEDNEMLQLVQGGEEKSHVADNNISEDMEHGLQIKEMELQNLISSTAAVGPSVCETATDEEIEEGEISGDTGVSDESHGYMYDDTISPEQGNAQVSIAAEKEFNRDGPDAKLQEKNVLTSFSNDTAHGCNNVSKDLLGKRSRDVEGDGFEMIVCQNDVETKKICGINNAIYSVIITEHVDGVRKVDSSATCFPLKTASEHATENQGSVAEAEDENETKKKKKRGPMTMEKRAKKKAKERIKRAEKNRKLGVKRLKLPPILKQNKVSICRHYLKGRCQEGEKCKFSHDTIPLTKSKPCCHFARHSCMKGDDCPYDHELSKYPCTNFVSNGFCSRGSDCLFSHKVPAKTESSTTPIISKAESKSPLLSSILSPKVQVNAHGSSQPFLGNSTVQTVGEAVQKLPALAPKGVNFLMHGKLPVGDTKLKEASLSKEGDSGKYSQEELHSKMDNTQKPSDEMKVPTSRMPQGINFLSFGRSPSTYSSFKRMPNSLDGGYGIGKFQLGESSKGKDTSSPKSGDGCRNEMKASSSASLWSLSQSAAGTLPKSTPRGISVLSFGKASLDGTSSTEQAIIRSKECNIASPVVPSHQPVSQFVVEQSVGMPDLSKSTFFANMPSSAQKALRSTLAFAAQFESGIKLDQSISASVASSNIKEHP